MVYILLKTKFGSSLIWDESEDNRICAMRNALGNDGYRNPETDWDRIIQEGIDAMIRMGKATRIL